MTNAIASSPSEPATGAGILPLAAFTDNYIWLIHHNGDAVVVDPGESEPVLKALHANKLQLRAILLTHHHGDHVGGVTELVNRTGARVYGPATETLPICDVRLAEGDRVVVPEVLLDMHILDVPGHTSGHIAYFGRAAGVEAVVFSGDTLFSGGCGRLFEGTPDQMVVSLEKFSALPVYTQVFCGHEYTLANLRWAQAVDPANVALQQAYDRASGLRRQGLPTLPSTIGQERETNPFLRAEQANVAKAAEVWVKRPLHSPVEVFAALREWKNNFK
jgi:hydroxyacylglutathione hydrolase